MSWTYITYVMEDLNGEETFYGKQLQYANQTYS